MCRRGPLGRCRRPCAARGESRRSALAEATIAGRISAASRKPNPQRERRSRGARGDRLVPIDPSGDDSRDTCPLRGRSFWAGKQWVLDLDDFARVGSVPPGFTAEVLSFLADLDTRSGFPRRRQASGSGGRRIVEKTCEPDWRDHPVGINAQFGDLGPVAIPVEPYADPASAADVLRAEESLRVAGDQVLLGAVRGCAPEVWPYDLVVALGPQHHELALDEERWSPVARPFGHFWQREADLSHAPGDLELAHGDTVARAAGRSRG